MYFALAMGGLVATLAPLAELADSRRLPRLAWRAELALGAFVLACAPLALVLRDGVEAYFYARATGGRFNERGTRIESDGDKVAVLRWLTAQPFAPALGSGSVGLHPSMHANWSQVWALGGRTVDLKAQPERPGASGVVVADSRFVPERTRKIWFDAYSITAIGPVWIVRGGAREPAAAMAVVESEPSPFERYFVSGTEPHRAIAPDPYATWELDAHYGDAPPAPDAVPSTREEHRVRYDIAVSAGDVETMRAERDAMTRGCAPLDATFADGTHLFAACYADGVAPKLTLLFEASGPLSPQTELSVESRVVAGPRFSTTMADPVVREQGFPFALPPGSFKKGFVYAQPVWIRKRPGREVFTARFVGEGAPAIAEPVLVLTL
jgi:hypothetical protein